MPLALRETTSSVPASRLEALRSRHSKIEAELDQESRNLSASDLYLRQLKKQKLTLKEEIEGIASATG